jgi:uncharacterized ferredoxin-like protein
MGSDPVKPTNLPAFQASAHGQSLSFLPIVEEEDVRKISKQLEELSLEGVQDIYRPAREVRKT